MAKTRFICAAALFATITFCGCRNATTSKHSTPEPNTTKASEAKKDTAESKPNKRFGKSVIINSAFDTSLIFGVWTKSYDDPACDFELDARRFLICDYDGDGERLYKIIGDSIFLDNPYNIFRGKILNAVGGSLVIHWQNNEYADSLFRMKQ